MARSESLNTCEIVLRAHNGSPLTQFDGGKANLLLATGGLSIAIGFSQVARGHALWTVANIGDLLGISDAPLPARFLSVAISRQSAEMIERATGQSSSIRTGFNSPGTLIASFQADQPPLDERVALYAPILDETGADTGAIPVEVIVASVGYEDGHLTIGIVMPPITRAAYPDHHMTIDLAASHNRVSTPGLVAR